MQWKLFVTVAVVVVVDMSLSPMAAGAQLDEPMPPRVEFATIPAGQLHLGMTEQEATRIMGEPARIAGYDSGGINARKLEFSGAISTKVTLSDGKVSRVALDVFQVEKGDLPLFSRKAWPGTTSGVVRRALGEPGDIRHYTFFGINLDQWVYDGAGGPEVSIVFAADRVIAKRIGRSIPPDIFQVRLPAPPRPQDETGLRGPQVGMSMSDIQALYGEVKFRVDYVFKGQPAVHAIFETRARNSFVSLTFVDDRLIEAEDLGIIRDWSILEGR